MHCHHLLELIMYGQMLLVFELIPTLVPPTKTFSSANVLRLRLDLNIMNSVLSLFSLSILWVIHTLISDTHYSNVCLIKYVLVLAHSFILDNHGILFSIVNCINFLCIKYVKHVHGWYILRFLSHCLFA